jgi:hypothetical protein
VYTYIYIYTYTYVYTYIGSDEHEEDDDYEVHPINQNNYNQNDSYNESISNYSIKQPLFPSEHGYNDSRYENENLDRVRSTSYPPLKSNNIKQPLIYHKTHTRTPPKPFLNKGLYMYIYIYICL